MVVIFCQTRSHTSQPSQLRDSTDTNTAPQVKIWVQLPRGRAKFSVAAVTTVAPDVKKRSQPVREQRSIERSIEKSLEKISQYKC